ncbi:MAG: S8 family serine peptidase [Pseudomonadota bacterium]|nr:S8 family serine peptidase [Pseudomonadota bacterium]
MPEEPEAADPYFDDTVARLAFGPYALSDAPIEVWAILRRDDWDFLPNTPVQVELALLEGRAVTWGDVRAIEQGAREERQAAAAAALVPFVRLVGSLGGTVEEVVYRSAAVRMILPESALPDLVRYERLSAVHEPTESIDDAGYAWTVTGTTVNGYELEDLLQSTQFYSRGYYGNERIGLIEPAGNNVYRTHDGFEDDAGVIRFDNCTWSGSACSNSSPDPAGPHSTGTASILLGDITRGQDPSIFALGTNRRARSGVARRATGRGVTDGSDLSNVVSVFTSGTYGVNLSSHSASYLSDATCAGTDTPSVNYNSLYEEGIALFKSASNPGHDSTTNCTVGSPGSAIGAFTVGAYAVDSSHDEVIWRNSSTYATARGGTSYAEGRDRTIIGLAGPSSVEFPYAFDSTLLDGSGNPLKYGTDWPGDGISGPQAFCCTSSATPAVAGAAALFKQWFLDIMGTEVNDPGILYANMLLMGDRTTQTGTDATLSYDNLWGAGKLRLRAFDGTGLDGPAGWDTGYVCVDSGTTVSVPIGSGVLSSDVDTMRVVSWWYDGRHDSGIDSDEVGMRLVYTNSLGSATIVAIDNTSDNRQRIHKDSPVSGMTYSVKFTALDVTADDEGCGANSMRVYYAYFYEDSDREEAEALDNVRPE